MCYKQNFLLPTPLAKFLLFWFSLGWDGFYGISNNIRFFNAKSILNIYIEYVISKHILW